MRSAVVRTLVLALVAVLPAGAQTPTAAQDDGLTVRAFDVRYRSLSDAADLVGDQLSAEGSLTLKPRLGVFVVEDKPEVLLRVESLLLDFDIAPRNVHLTFSLFLATERAEEERSESAARRGVIDLPSLEFTKYTDYEPLGSRSVTGVERERVSAILSDDWRVVFVVESVDERQGVVKFESISLQRLDRDIAETQTYKDILVVNGVIRVGRQNLIGGATAPDADRALFLALQAKLR